MAVVNRGPQVNGVAGLFLALSTITILLRCYCRALVVKNFGLDDWSALVAWVRLILCLDEVRDAEGCRYSSFSSVLLPLLVYTMAQANTPLHCHKQRFLLA
jgi:hypothetical protein